MNSAAPRQGNIALDTERNAKIERARFQLSGGPVAQQPRRSCCRRAARVSIAARARIADRIESAAVACQRDVGRTFDRAFDDRSGEPQALNIRRDWLQLLENARTRRDQAPVTGACETRVIATSVAQ